MHCALQDGTLTTEANLLLEACEGSGFTSSDLEAHFQNDWVFPQQHRSKGKLLWRIFDQSRKGLQDKVNASASEMLLLYVLLRHYSFAVLGIGQRSLPSLNHFAQLALVSTFCYWRSGGTLRRLRLLLVCRLLFGIMVGAMLPPMEIRISSLSFICFGI